MYRGHLYVLCVRCIVVMYVYCVLDVSWSCMCIVCYMYRGHVCVLCVRCIVVMYVYCVLDVSWSCMCIVC